MSTKHPPKKASPEDWHPADVVAALHKKGTSLRRLSSAHGLTPTALDGALRESYPSWQQIIADCIGLPPQTIWPSRYEADGSPKRGLRRKPHQQAKSSKAMSVVNGNPRGAE